MKTLAAQAVQAINGYKNNKVVMAFVEGEALEKTASDIRAKTGSGTTAKAVELLVLRNKEVKARFDSYVNAGLVGCYFASVA